MGWLVWLLVISLSLLLGVLLVGFMTEPPSRMIVFLLGATAAGAGLTSVLLCGLIGPERWLAVLAAAASALLGYWFMTRRVLTREDPRPVPALVRRKDDPGAGHTAVIYFTHGEPETYSPVGWINQFKEFDEQGIAFVPLLARPLFIFKLRQKYLQVGKSGHRQMHARMLESLERAFRDQGDRTTRFYLCFLDDDPRPDAAVIQALNEGASRIVVAEVFLTISNHTAEGKSLITELCVPEQFGVPVEYTGPMYDSDTLQSMFVQRANAHLEGTPKDRVGVLLVGHGQPDEWDQEWPTETDQEIGFRENVLERLEADGYARDHLGLAWMEFKTPPPAHQIASFVQRGVQRVLYFSAAISADAIHSQVDVPELVERARVPKGFPLINLGAWNDDPIVIRAIKEKVDAVMNG